MLSSILKTEVVASVSVGIMRAFVAMRKYISNNLLEQKHINNMVLKHDDEIIIIDNYIDKSLLDILRKINKKILIINNKYNNDDYNKYKKQYKNITLKINNRIHDRFIIIDKSKLYHCGSGR